MQKYAAIVNMYAEIDILVIGDCIVDQYHWGRVERISPEAPVPIFLEDRIEPRRGGSDNVAHQLEVLGCSVDKLFASKRSIKHRYFAGHHQVFRMDEDWHEAPSERHLQYINDCAESYDAIVLSDYGKGFLTEEICQAVMRRGIPVVVDPKGTDWVKYEGATVICPNESEWKSVGLHQPQGTSIVAKHGDKGLAVITADAEAQYAQLFPARARSVYDVTGAGDTVTALIAASVAVEASLQDSAHIANIAASIVVGKLGTAVCQKEELLKALEGEGTF